MQTVAVETYPRKNYFNTISLVVGLLLFLLPFVEIKCNTMTIAHNTGIGLALGSEYKVSKEMSSLGDKEVTKDDTKNEKSKMYIVALAAFALGVLGLILSLMKGTSLSKSAGILALLASILLFVLMFQVKSDVEKEMANQGGSGNNPMEQMSQTMKPVISFTMWYYLAIASFLAAAVFSFRKPTTPYPPHAPQVPINNPGDQSEFPSAPTGEKNLG